MYTLRSSVSNEAIKPSRICEHLAKKHPDKKDKDISYFQALRRQFANPSSIDGFLHKVLIKNDDGLVESYNMSLLIAKCGKPHTIEEKFILLVIRVAISTIMRHASSVI